jgi:hypothetical protein
MKETRLTFEENVTSAQADKASTQKRLHSWRAYIDFEIKDKQLSRAQRLYERALLECLSSASSTDDDTDDDTAGGDGDGAAVSLFLEEYLHFAANVKKDYQLLGE